MAPLFLRFCRHCFCVAHVDDHHQPSASVNFGIVVHRMVRDMAVEQPFPGPARSPGHVIPLPGPHIDGVGEKASRIGGSRSIVATAIAEKHAASIGRSSLELSVISVTRMMPVSGVDGGEEGCHSDHRERGRMGGRVDGCPWCATYVRCSPDLSRPFSSSGIVERSSRNLWNGRPRSSATILSQAVRRAAPQPEARRRPISFSAGPWTRLRDYPSHRTPSLRNRRFPRRDTGSIRAASGSAAE